MFYVRALYKNVVCLNSDFDFILPSKCCYKKFLTFKLIVVIFLFNLTKTFYELDH